jgi:hypothetical protein
MATTYTEADIQAAITKAVSVIGLGADGAKWMNLIRRAETGNATRTDIKNGETAKDGAGSGKAMSSARGLWQVINSTWNAARSQVPASEGVPENFSTDPYHQALIAAVLIKGYLKSGYGSDPRLMYIAHFSPTVAKATKKRLSAGEDFQKAFSDGIDEALAGKLGSQYKNGARKLTTQDQMRAVVYQEVNGGIERIRKIDPSVPAVGPTTFAITPLTDSQKISYAGGGVGEDIVINQEISLNTGPAASGFTPSITITEGLDTPSWCEKDGGSNEILVGNPKLVSIPARGVFQVSLDENTTKPLMAGKNAAEVRLNVSLKTLSVRSRHVIHKRPTRTGFHLTFWGMEPDILSGSGTTGLFLNQFGPASVMSLSNPGSLLTDVSNQYASRSKKLDINVRAEGITRIDSEHPLEMLLTAETKPTRAAYYSNLIVGAFSDFLGLGAGDGSGYVNRDNIFSSDVAAWSDTKSRYGATGFFGSLFPSSKQKEFRAKYTVDKRLEGLLGPGDATDAFRVPAQDAFNELLQLFKNNGQIRFHNENYDGKFNELQQAGPTSWDKNTGLSRFQGNARNNDVFTRGIIIFKMKGSTYFGYFKSLNFSMNAETPFTWDFDFTFYVVRTIKSVYIPDLMYKGENA